MRILKTHVTCDLCKRLYCFEWVDGRTKVGPYQSWAYMCKPCFGQYGIGLGTGKGQQYRNGQKVAG